MKKFMITAIFNDDYAKKLGQITKNAQKFVH